MTNPAIREWKESPFYHGANEQIAYTLTVPTSWGTASLTNLTNTLYEDPDGANTDVSATKLSGSTTASGQVITTKVIISLTAGKKYRLDVQFDTSEGNQEVAFAIVYGQR